MSAVLLDTHALIWLTEEDPSLGQQSRQLADDAVKEHGLLVSAITFWEVAMLARRGRIDMGQPPLIWRQRVLELGVEEVALSGATGVMAAELEDFHADPADRFITATAIARGATLVTADERILGWGGALLKRDARF